MGNFLQENAGIILGIVIVAYLGVSCRWGYVNFIQDVETRLTVLEKKNENGKFVITYHNAMTNAPLVSVVEKIVYDHTEDNEVIDYHGDLDEIVPVGVFAKILFFPGIIVSLGLAFVFASLLCGLRERVAKKLASIFYQH